MSLSRSLNKYFDYRRFRMSEDKPAEQSKFDQENVPKPSKMVSKCVRYFISDSPNYPP